MDFLDALPAVRFWRCWIDLDRQLRALIGERMERGATDELDRKLATLIEQQRRTGGVVLVTSPRGSSAVERRRALPSVALADHAIKSGRPRWKGLRLAPFPRSDRR